MEARLPFGRQSLGQDTPEPVMTGQAAQEGHLLYPYQVVLRQQMVVGCGHDCGEDFPPGRSLLCALGCR